MLRLSLAGQGEGRNVLVGEELAGIIPAISADSVVNLSGPEGLNERLAIQVEAGEGRWSYSPVLFSGAYEARLGSNGHRYAANLNTREGDLARLDPELLPAQFRREPASTPVETKSLAAGNSQHFRWLLGAVLTLLVIEPWLAWRFGRGRQ